MSLHTELLLFEPERGIVFGMPVFVSSDDALTHRLLRHHGEWWDNASLWFAGYFAGPARIELFVSFNESSAGHRKNGGRRYARDLIPQLSDRWRAEPAPDQEDATIKSTGGAAGKASTSLARAWLSHRMGMPTPITPRRPGGLLAQRGYWFPCDGAIAMVLSTLAPPGLPPPAVIEWLMRDIELVERLRNRAECCFLFRISLVGWQPNLLLRRTHISWGRPLRLHNRHGCLFEADIALNSEVHVVEPSR